MSHFETVDTIETVWDFHENQFIDWHEYLSESPSPENGIFTQESHASPEWERRNMKYHNEHPSTPAETFSESRTSRDRRSKSSETEAQKPDLSLSAAARRRSQNRTSQRAFRARQRQHAEALEEKMKFLLMEHEHLQQQYALLGVAYQTLQSKTEGITYFSSGDYETGSGGNVSDISMVSAARRNFGRGSSGISSSREGDQERRMWVGLDRELCELVATAWDAESQV